MNKNRTSFWIAGGLLILSAVFSQILAKNVAQVLILGLSGLGFTMLGYTKQGRKQITCEARMLKKNPLKSIVIILGVTVIFGGIGFLFGQLLYNVIN
ncbi:hypothetical protein [uncultured Croceitalea sp.]